MVSRETSELIQYKDINSMNWITDVFLRSGFATLKAEAVGVCFDTLSKHNWPS